MSAGGTVGREEAERAFKQAFAALVNQGMPPNVAAARALAQISVGVLGASSSSSGSSKPDDNSTEASSSGSGGEGSENEGAKGPTAATTALEEAAAMEVGGEGEGDDGEPMTVEELRARVAMAEASGTYAPVADWLRACFSSFTTLDRSFLLAPPSSSEDGMVEDGDGDGGAAGIGLDLEAVTAFYVAVAEAEAGRQKACAAAKMEEEEEEEEEGGNGGRGGGNDEEEDSLLLAVREGLALLAEHLHAENQALMAASAAARVSNATAGRPLRPYVILLDNPELADPSYHHPVAQHLYAAIVLLPNKDKDRLRDWIADADAPTAARVAPPRFARWLAAVQQYISIRVLTEQSERSFRDVRCAVRTLAILYVANQRRSYSLAPLSDFYQSAINEEIERPRDEDEDEDEDDEEARMRRDFLHLHHEYDKWRADRLRLQRLRREQRTEELRAFEPRSLGFGRFLLWGGGRGGARLLQLDAREQMRAEIEDEMQAAVLSGANTIRPYLVLRIDRDDVVNSAIHCLALYESYELKKKLKVQFINEEGVDEGGLSKEFFHILLRKMFDRNYGMFLPSSEEGEGGAGLLYFNPDTFNGPEEFELIGILLGVAVHNSIILDLHFPPAVYKKLMGQQVGLDDLSALQPAVAHSLARMLDPYSFSDADFEALGQRFELSFEAYGALKTVELVPNGAGILVTRANVGEYVDKYVEWVLTSSVAGPFEAFQRGFLKVCGGDALRLFQPQELELLLCGNPVLDFEALERVALYEDGLDSQAPLVKNFWGVVHAFSEEEKRLFLKFLTGSDRAPINGLGSLQFVISANGDDSDRLPSAHTCFNHLLLPRYATKEKLENRLKLAIHQSEGFGLR